MADKLQRVPTYDVTRLMVGTKEVKCSQFGPSIVDRL